VLAEMSAGVKQLYTIKLLVYKNGEGRLKPSELMIGSSVQGVSHRDSIWFLNRIFNFSFNHFNSC